MEPRQVKTAADARRIVKERGLSHVKVGVHDIDGILRGKYIHIDKFHSALDGGMGFCDVVLGWDINDATPVAMSCAAMMSDWFPATTGEMIHVDGGFHAMGV